MPYNAGEIEKQFRDLGRSRKGRKKYANDASYWDGGRCNWGGGHSLREDCQTLAGSFGKMESLRDIKEELKKCTSKSEYDAKKNNYIRKCEESLRGLQEKSASSSMFGICIIWSDEGMDKHVISKLNNFSNDLTKLKGELERESYKWVEELNQLNLEIGKLEAEIQKQRKEALDEKDPVRRGRILQLIEENGKILEGKYKKKQELANKFNFDPKKKINDLIESIKKAVERKNRKGSGGSGGRNSRTDTNLSDSDDEIFHSGDNSDSDDNTSNNGGSGKNNKNTNFFQNNQQLILIAGLAVLVIFYLYSQSSKTKEPNYYDL